MKTRSIDILLIMLCVNSAMVSGKILFMQLLVALMRRH
jgi:hypothetical protein